MDYFIEKNGKRFGPYSVSELSQRLKSGRITSSDRAISEDGEKEISVGALLKPTKSPTTNQEEVLWRGRVSLWHYFWHILAGVLLSIVLIGIFILLWVYLDRARRRFTVTNRRVKMTYGILTRSTREIRINDVRSVNVRNYGILGMMGIGTVEFYSSGSGGVDVEFENIQGAHRVRELVTSMQP